MKKIKNEKELVHEAIKIGTVYFEKRGAGTFDSDDHADLKVKAIYTLLVKDKLIQALPKGEDNTKMMKHKLAIWISKQLAEDHPLNK